MKLDHQQIIKIIIIVIEEKSALLRITGTDSDEFNLFLFGLQLKTYKSFSIKRNVPNVNDEKVRKNQWINGKNER